MSAMTLVEDRQAMAAAQLYQQVSKSQLLPQILREMIIEQIVAADAPAAEPQERQLRLQQFQQANWQDRVGAYFLERKTQLDRVIYSMMEVTEDTIAQELYFRIASGEKQFHHLARKYSQGAAAIDGGRIGPISIGRIEPAIAARLINLEPGQLSPILAMADRFIFVRLESRIPVQLDDNIRQLLVNELFERWLQERVASQIGAIADLN